MKTPRIEYTKRGFLLAWISLSLFVSCEDFVEIDPPTTEVTGESVFDNIDLVSGAVNGMYSEMVFQDNNIFNGSLEVFTGTASDELNNFSSSQDNEQFATNEIAPMNSIIDQSFWSFAYSTINRANFIIEGLNSSSLEGPIRNQLLGEAYFIRAFSHFYLANLFGDIPYVISTSVEVNTSIEKSSVNDVYLRIVEDLIIAKELMLEDFSFNENGNRTRPNQAAATALLARVYLYQEEWSLAEAEASQLINNGLFSIEPSLNDVFLETSNEAIWQLSPNKEPLRTYQGVVFVIKFGVGFAFWTTALSEDLVNSFEDGDNRARDWVGAFNDFRYSNKYKIGFGDDFDPAEFLTVFRLGEQYLIRSEARAQLNDIIGAQDYLNLIRNRSGLSNVSVPDRTTLLEAIEQERRVELFTEWGHRWFDLKRTNRASEVLSGFPDKQWEETDVLWPLPERDLLNNPNLQPQNPGYNN